MKTTKKMETTMKSCIMKDTNKREITYGRPTMMRNNQITDGRSASLRQQPEPNKISPRHSLTVLGLLGDTYKGRTRRGPFVGCPQRDLKGGRPPLDHKN